MTARRAQPEAELQRSVVRHLRLRGARGVVFWHTPNGAYLGGKRNKRGIAIQGAIMKSLGVKAGVADILCLHGGRLFSLELKTRGNHSTEAQIAWRDDVNRAGGFAAEATGLDAAVRTLEQWGLLRGTFDPAETRREPLHQFRHSRNRAGIPGKSKQAMEQ